VDLREKVMRSAPAQFDVRVFLLLGTVCSRHLVYTAL